MYRHLLILPDGTELFSGEGRENAVMAVSITELVNDNRELMPGSVCAACLEATLFTPESGLSLSAGDTVTVYRVDEANHRHLAGIFQLDEPVRPTAHTMKLVGYDAVTKLDKDLTQWLCGLTQWPYSVAEFAKMVCSACGLDLESEELPNGDFFIQAFTGDGVTGRKLLQWLGQITGRFCRATSNGSVKFDWYTPNEGIAIAPTSSVGATWYFQDSLQYEDYQVCPIEKVQLRQSSEDIGTVYPNVSGEKNTYIIENNPMLAAQDSTTLVSVARTLYAQMQAITYTPGKVIIPSNGQIQAGDILTVTNALGKSFSFYVMKKVSNGHTDALECTGSCRRDSSSAVNNAGYRALSGKVLNLRADVDGLKVESQDAAGRLASLQLDLEGIRSQVAGQETGIQNAAQQVSVLTQRADSLALELETVQTSGSQKVHTTAGYTFDDQGLHISRSDSQIENTLDHTGMYVRRMGEVILQANNQGVQATDVTVRNYLVMGNNARLEDYGSGRTACFYIG